MVYRSERGITESLSLCFVTDVRFLFQALIAVLPQAQMKYFDVESKTWKPLPSTIPSIEANRCDCAVSVGNTLFVAGFVPGIGNSRGNSLYRYDTESNVWEIKPHSRSGSIHNLYIIDDYIYVISSDLNQVPERYNTAKRQWQSISKVSIEKGYQGYYLACNNGVVVQSKVFVLYGRKLYAGGYQPAILQCFDADKNEWELKAKTCHLHYGSSLFLVNSKLYVAGGYVDIDGNNKPCGNPSPVEVYNEETNTWSVVEQKHIPANNLGAVEIEGRVYFIINKFPVDSGIRIPPGEMYPVPLGEWENLGKISNTAVLCYFPIKRANVKTD